MIKRSRDTRRITTVNSPAEIPEFASEVEEADFWDTHSLGDGFPVEEDAELEAEIAAAGGKFGVSLEIDADTAERLRSLARRRKVSYLALIRQFIAERLYEEEKRDGIISTR
jgi:hypothetical protein